MNKLKGKKQKTYINGEIDKVPGSKHKADNHKDINYFPNHICKTISIKLIENLLNYWQNKIVRTYLQFFLIF